MTKNFGNLLLISTLTASFVFGCSSRRQLSLTGSKKAPNSPATPETAKILKEARRILGNVRDTDYTYNAVIDEAAGKYHLMCAQLTDYILGRALPAHYKIFPKRTESFGQILDYYRFFEPAREQFAKEMGWKLIFDPKDARPGDFIYWEDKNPETGDITGHIAVMDSMAEETIDGEFKINVIDSTFRGHRISPAEKRQVGIGTGYMWFHVDENGKIDGYRWSGEHYKLFKPVFDGRSSILFLCAVEINS